MAFGNVAVVIVTAVVTEIPKVRLACCTGLKLSETCAEKMKLPGLVGVPLKTPDSERLSPGGMPAPRTVHLYGGFPPAAASESEYELVIVADGRFAGVDTVSGAWITLRDVLVTVCTGFPPVAWTVKSNVAGTVGVPTSVPFANSVTPGGGIREMTDPVMGDGPSASRD